MEKEELNHRISELMKFLHAAKEDRGVMADLRRGFNENTQQRAWPHIAKFCDIRNERERKIFQLVSAGFAMHKSSANHTMGEVMRKIAMGDGRGNDGLASFEARFRRLLSSSNVEDLINFLPGIIRTAQVKGVGINFYQLFKDLWYWNEQTKIEWAAKYWGAEEHEENSNELPG